MTDQEANEEFFRVNRDDIIGLPWKFFGGVGSIQLHELDANQAALVDTLHSHHFGSKRDGEFHVNTRTTPKHSLKHIILEKAKNNAADMAAKGFMVLPWKKSFNQLYGQGVTDIYLELGKDDLKALPDSQQKLIEVALELSAIERDIYCKNADPGKTIYLARNSKLLEKLCDRFNVDPDRRVNVRYEREGWRR